MCRIVFCAFLLLFPVMAHAHQPEGPVFLVTLNTVEAPHGFVRFCKENPKECISDKKPRARIEVDLRHRLELDEVNALVNTSIAPATDMEIYGEIEYWTIPAWGTRGDCEDYVLLKRHELIKRGWPISVLLITVVLDENGEGHAVLTIPTTAGDLVLDNKTGLVLFWNQTPYRYATRQSAQNARVWKQLGMPVVVTSAPR